MCTPLWREAHFESKCAKHTMPRAVRSKFRSQNVQNTPCSGALLEVEMMKKWTPLWREAHVQVKILKTNKNTSLLHAPGTFAGSDVVLRGRGKGFCTLPKVSKR